VKSSGPAGFLAAYVVSQKSSPRKKSPTYGRIIAHSGENHSSDEIPAQDLAYLNSINNLQYREVAGILRFAFPLFFVPAHADPIRLGTVVFEFDTKVIYAPIVEVRNSILFVSVFLLLGSLVFAFLISGRLSRPIESLASAAERIAGGELGVTVQITTAGEIGQLGATFNHMSRSLKDSERLKTEQAAIKRELEIAQGIQVAMIPEPQKVGPYSFRGFMQTADEVGGDYVDVIHIDGRSPRFWFFIGDVSGHGLRAGLTMLMAQTAIHSTMEVSPDLEPSQAFMHVNDVLFANIRRLRERKYMTAAFYRADAKGNFSFAGLHQDALIYRAAGKKLEVVPTDGFWLGVDAGVKKDMRAGKFKLSVGDLLFLFTDGLVESMNGKKEMFGQEKIEEIVRKHGTSDLAGLEERIMNSLRAHTGGLRPADDITFAMIRREK
ncbi:MAG TPA: SpoIIE family protein phosphatase, partial [Leptospiraceae bacterium]|nr:SpoIIE family protein phosphatase [Leptospiraceae bacterium]